MPHQQYSNVLIDVYLGSSVRKQAPPALALAYYHILCWRFHASFLQLICKVTRYMSQAHRINLIAAFMLWYALATGARLHIILASRWQHAHKRLGKLVRLLFPTS